MNAWFEYLISIVENQYHSNEAATIILTMAYLTFIFPALQLEMEADQRLVNVVIELLFRTDSREFQADAFWVLTCWFENPRIRNHIVGNHGLVMNFGSLSDNRFIPQEVLSAMGTFFPEASALRQSEDEVSSDTESDDESLVPHY